jgi:tetratricopeptide (TPR) repeat protein
VAPQENPQELFAEALTYSDGPARARLLRKAAAALEDATDPESLGLRACIREQQGLWYGARKDATAAISGGHTLSRRLRLRIVFDRFLDSIMSLSPRYEHSWHGELKDDLEALGVGDPVVDARRIVAEKMIAVSDSPGRYKRDEVSLQIHDAFTKAVNRLEGATGDHHLLVLRSRLSRHLAEMSVTPHVYRKRMVKQAETDLAAALEAAPERTEVQRARLFDLLARKDREKARQEVIALAQFLPDSPEPIVILSQMQLHLGDKKEAMETLERAKELAERLADPPLWRALTRLGIGFVTGGIDLGESTLEDAKASLEDLMECVTLDPDDALAAYYIGFVQYNRLMDLTEAVKYLDRYIAAEPGTILARHARGWLEELKGPIQDDAHAVKKMRRARWVVNEVGHLEGGLRLNEMLLRKLDDDAEGPKKVSDFIRLRLQQIVNYNIACIYSKLGRIDEALKSLETAFSFGWSPSFEQALNDPDLENVRKDPRFDPLFKKYKR